MEFLPNLRLMSRSVCCICSSASPRGESLEPPSAERIASHSAASAEAESTGASIAANKSGCVYSDAAACRRSSSCSSVSTSAATTFSRRTSKRLSTIERKSLSTASQIRDVADVAPAMRSTRWPAWVRGGHTCRSKQGRRMLPRHVRQSPSNQRNRPCQAVSDRACRVVADHQSHSAGFHALRYQIQ